MLLEEMWNKINRKTIDGEDPTVLCSASEIPSSSNRVCSTVKLDTFSCMGRADLKEIVQIVQDVVYPSKAAYPFQRFGQQH